MMRDMERQLHLQDDHMSGNWSLDSNYHPCSQYRKISIGVIADSSAIMKGKNGKAVMAELQTSENITSSKDIPAECKQIGKEVMFPDLRRQNNTSCGKSSPLDCTTTSYPNISYSDVIGHPEKVSSVPSTNVLLQPSGSKIAGAMEPESFFANQMINPHTRDANEKKSKKNTYHREGGNHGLMDREEESSYATAKELLVLEKGITEQGLSERGNSGNLKLRMKVQELLGTVFSPSKKQYSSETFGMDANNLKPTSKTIVSESLVAMHRQHLDTRETNIASPNDKSSRPVTRSLTHSKPQAQKPAPKKQAPFCRYEKAHLDKNEFSFAETRSRRPSTDVTHGSTMCKRKEREISGTRPVKKCLVEEVHKDESQQVIGGRKTKAAAANVSLFANRTGDSEIVKPNTEMKQMTCHQTEVMMKRHQPGGNGTMLCKNVDQDPFAKQILANNVDPEYDLKSPTFELKTTAVISSSRSLSQINHEDIDGDSQSERGFKTKETCSSHVLRFSKGGQYNASTKNFGMGLPIVKPAMVIIGGCKEKKFSESPSKEVQSECSEDGSPATVPVILENCHENRWFVSPCQEEDSESSEDASLIKGDVDCDKFHDSSEQDGLVGAVKLFTLALERVESKIHSTTSRQSSKILLSVSKNIQSQLQNAESKIQNEVGRLTKLDKSKRMHTENQCQEQQELLKRIYKKFKEEVNQHLANCQSTLEGLEAHEIEVRGMIEKQRLSHRKLLMQTEEAIETQLNDAQRRVADVHRLAREKMLKLKNGITECLREGILS